MKPKQSLKVRLALAAGMLAAAVLGFVVVPMLLRGDPAAKKQVAIEDAVRQLKTQLTLPQQVDSVTTLTDVTAEPDAIHYHYSLASSVDPAQLTPESLKQTLKTTACQNSGVKNNLNRDIDIQYTYTAASQRQYRTTLTKADCP